MVFANAAARTAAIPSPTTGMTTYLQDTIRIETYNGSAWVADVTSLTAGTGVSVSSATGNSTISIGQSVATSAKPTFAGINSTQEAEFTTRAAAGRGVGIKAPAGDATPAILQFTNNAVTAQWASISSTNNALSMNAGTTNFSGTPRYTNAPNVYGWHSGNEQIGTKLVIGAWGQASSLNFSVANTWYTVGSVGITIPTGATVIEMVYNFTMYVAAAGQYLVRVLYNGGGTSYSDFVQFRNVSYDHFQVAGVRGLGVTGGTSGTIFLQIYGSAITLIADANDCGYFVVSTA